MAERSRRRPIRVVLVDDHPMLQEGTRRLLRDQGGIDVAGAAADGATALHLVEQLRPDVLLLDVHLPDVSGIEVTRQVRTQFPEVAVLILTGYDGPGYQRRLAQLGVRGYLRKTASGEEIVQAVREVASGRTVFPRERPGTGATPEALTPREYEVLELLAAGRRNAEIAAELSVSVDTAEFHVRQLLRKLGARSRTEAVAKARQQSLLAQTPDDLA